MRVHRVSRARLTDDERTGSESGECLRLVPGQHPGRYAGGRGILLAGSRGLVEWTCGVVRQGGSALCGPPANGSLGHPALPRPAPVTTAVGCGRAGPHLGEPGQAWAEPVELTISCRELR